MNMKRNGLSGLALKLFLCLVAVGVASAISVVTATASPAIVTQDGPLKGIRTATVSRYLGIPYAVPPVGPLRWMPPQPHGRWHGVLQATQFGNFCTQSGLGSEDCLYLNVYTPSQKKNQNKHHGLPVMVWIHGGGLVSGGGGLYDPGRMVELGGVIVVTINYRLGYLGFFAHPAIDAEGHLNGNYGLMDQQLALKWVQNNIAAFGGDPKRVTIFGESAGGLSVQCNLASPTAAGLFQRAISESGSFFEFQDYFDNIVPLAQAETIGNGSVPAGTTIAASVGCSSQTATCLRGVPASTLGALTSLSTVTLAPFVDGTILTQTPGAAFASGQFNQVPVISGGNHDEVRLFVASSFDFTGHPLVTPTDYANAVLEWWGPALDPFVLFFYPLVNYPSPGVALGASGTDGLIACPERNGVRLLSQYVTTYAYEFNDEDAYLVNENFFYLLFALSPPFPSITFSLGASHFSELPYLFDVFYTPSNFTPDQERLAKAMISYWTQFAATGDPNSTGEPPWSPYSSITDEFQSLVPPTPTVESNFDSDHFCSSFWNLF
jgi:para-nitrobenzyl esterase